LRQSIRRLEAHDLPDIAAIHAACFETVWDMPAMEGLWNSGVRGHIIERDRTPIAFLLFRQAADEGEIISVATMPRYMRQGLAKQLVDQLISHARREGIAALFLEVREDNAAALGLYRSQGFEVIASRKDYYRMNDGTMRHASVMRKELL
jgi:[ribosomal protein S18]-alanine N-acetyltransferase